MAGVRRDLSRSLGGCSAVLALRRRKEKHRSDTRILGDAEFVQEVTSDLDDLVKKNLRLSGDRLILSCVTKLVSSGKKPDKVSGDPRGLTEQFAYIKYPEKICYLDAAL